MATNNDSLKRQIAAIEEGLSILKIALVSGGYKRESIPIIAGNIVIANLFLGEEYPLSNALDIQAVIGYLQRAHTALQQTYLQQTKAVPIESNMFALKGALEQRNIPVESLPRSPIGEAPKPPSEVSFCSPALTPAATENTTTPTAAQLSAVKNALEQKNFQVSSLPRAYIFATPTTCSSYQFYSPASTPFTTENRKGATAIQRLKEDSRPMNTRLGK